MPELEESVFYIDLVCSQDRLGGRILAALEDYGKGQGLKVAALRAADPPLVRVYERKGYKRIANACVTPSRAGRIALRDLDKFAPRVWTKQEGIYTDGTRVVSSSKDAWRAWRASTKKKPPATAFSSTLPDGWWFEEGSHGWWMSKCIA